jgi:hypothetical protein
MISTKAARAVLKDATLVRKRLEDEVDTVQWRLDWVLVVVLLRAVGHVLLKVDGKSEEFVKVISTELFNNWKNGEEHRIFREFIELERNSIIKEYETQMTQGPVPIALQLMSTDGTSQIQQFVISENIYRPISGGFYEGEDGRTLVDDAIQWWERQLDEVDCRVFSMRQKGKP